MEDDKNNLLGESDLNVFLNARFLPIKGGLDSPIYPRLAQLSPSFFVTFIILYKEILLKLL